MKLQDFVQDKPVLETERLILRPLRKEDVSDLKEWLGDSSIYCIGENAQEKAT